MVYNELQEGLVTCSYVIIWNLVSNLMNIHGEKSSNHTDGSFLYLQFHEPRIVWQSQYNRAELEENCLIFQAIVELHIGLWLFSQTQECTETLEKKLLVHLSSISRKEGRCTLVRNGSLVDEGVRQNPLSVFNRGAIYSPTNQNIFQ